MLLNNIFKERRSAVVNPTHPRDEGLIKLFGLNNYTSSGMFVSPDSAWRIAAAAAAIKVIAETLANLPLFVYRKTSDGGKEQASEHPLYDLLHSDPNRADTSYDWRLFTQSSILTHGNALNEILYTQGGAVGEIMPLMYDEVRVFWANDKRRAYEVYSRGNSNRILLQDEVFHVMGPSKDRLTGMSPIRECMESFGLSMAAEKFGSRFFTNDARPSVVLKHPQPLGPEAVKNISDSWEERFKGVERSHRPAVLEEGMEIQTIGIPPEEAQFLETRKFQRSEIASIFRVPPHMIGDLEKATFSNIEQQSLEFVIYTMGPWLVAWEQKFRKSLLTPKERLQYNVEFKVDGLLRGDIQARYNAYAQARQWGWLSVNDIRKLENQNKIENGDVYLQPLNMGPAGALPNPPDNPDPQGDN